MSEERINSAAETIHSANRLSITKGILNIVAAEAREEGIDELRDALERYGDIAFRAQQEAERLKEQGE